jgi:hypothetical protein
LAQIYIKNRINTTIRGPGALFSNPMVSAFIEVFELFNCIICQALPDMIIIFPRGQGGWGIYRECDNSRAMGCHSE